MNNRLSRIASLLVLLAAADASAVPLVEATYLQGFFLPGADQLPGFNGGDGFFDPGDVVRSNGTRELVAYPNGSYVTTVNTGDFGDNSGFAGVYYLFGTTNVGGVSPAALRREATLSGQQQLTLGSYAGVDYSGNTSYSAAVPNPFPGGSSRAGSLWEDGTLVYVEGNPIPSGPLAGSLFGGAGGVYRSPAGETTWVTSYTTETNGDHTGTALLRGTSTFDVLLQSGDTIPGLGTIGVDPDGSTIEPAVIWSQLGTNYITEVGIPNGGTDDTGGPTFDDAPVVNGAALFTNSGAVLKEQSPLPVADGGLAGETFSFFQNLDVNEAGNWVVGASTNGVPDAVDDVIIRNGAVVYRSGEVVDGVPLTGQLQGVGLNDRGDLAFAWNDTLFINGQAIAGSDEIVGLQGDDVPGLGTGVDTDGDGAVDATIGGDGLALGKFEITNWPAAGGDGLPVVYFSGETSATLDTYFRLVPATSITGDYSFDGVVNLADYTVWRDTLGSELFLAADGDGDNVIDQDDYDIWVGAFGNGSLNVAVPEPGGAVMIALATLSVVVRRR